MFIGNEEAAPAQSGSCAGAPPPCNTGAEITIHWLRGTFQESGQEMLEYIETYLPGNYVETLDWGHWFYQKQHVFANGMRLYVEPRRENMPPCLLECPGSACETIPFETLQFIFCNSRLSRVDVAFDHAPFTPRQVAQWIREDKLRCRAKTRKYNEDLSELPDGETVYVGSRESEKMVRFYDARGFTRVELEMKAKTAAAFLEVMLLPREQFTPASVGVLREYLDFVETSTDSNKSRAKILPLWEQFTQLLERVKLHIPKKPELGIEAVSEWLEQSVSAMLYTYARAGRSVGNLLKLGKERLRPRHQFMLREVSMYGS